MDIKKTLYSKFERYVKVDTTSNPANAAVTPSTQEQFVLAKMLAKELKDLGLKNILITKHCYVLAELPANTKKKMPSIAFIAHMDTVADSPGKNVKPKLHHYKGGKLVINAQKKMFIDPKDSADLRFCKGHDIVSSSGDTLLGGDDKAAIAIVMTMLQYLKENPSFKHGPVKVAFTPDEEIGHGSELLPLDRLKADFGYTLDSGVNKLEFGNFNANGVTIDITGKVTHTGSGKADGMINPIYLAAQIITRWPDKYRSECTEGTQGFIHFKDITGGMDKVTIKALSREHDLKKMKKMEQELVKLCKKVEKEYSGSKIDVSFKEQYRNMLEIHKKHPQAVNLLLKALKEEKVKYINSQARGGTDGARLSFRGLPTPNMMCGFSAFHSRYEWVSLDIMQNMFRVCLNIIKER